MPGAYLFGLRRFIVAEVIIRETWVVRYMDGRLV